MCARSRRPAGVAVTNCAEPRSCLVLRLAEFAAGLLQALERVRDECAIEYRVDRPAEPEQLDVTAVGAGRQFLPRTLVVEQDTPVQVADDDALAEVRHQCRQPAPLFLERGARFAHPLGDIVLARFAQGEQLIDRLRQHPQLGRTLLANAQAAVGEGRRHFFRHAQRRSCIQVMQPDDYPAAAGAGEQQQDDEDDDALRRRPADTAGVGLARQHQCRRCTHQHEREQAGSNDRQDELARSRHRLHAE
jgi:hypothetical protein